MILILALGIGATTAVFSIVNGVLLRPLPYSGAEQMYRLWAEHQQKGWTRSSMSQPDIENVRELPSVAFAEGFRVDRFTLTGSDKPVQVDGAYVTGGLMAGFGVAPVLGRDIRHEENHPSAARVVVLGHALWQRRFGSDPSVVGTTLQISEESYEIVGVAPRGFDFPDGSQLWTPHNHPCHATRGCRNLNAVARLAPTAVPEQAQASLSALAAALREEFPVTNGHHEFRFEGLMDSMVWHVRTGLWVLLGAVGLMLLVVCANVANLLLARGSARELEMGIRAALGASRARLMGQLLLESLLLAALGGAVGLMLSNWLVAGVKRVLSGTFPRFEQVSVDATVLVFILGVTVLVAVLFGLSPAVHLVRRQIVSCLARGGRVRSGRRGSAARSWLMVAEVGLSVVLLIGAGLIARSLLKLYQVDQGFGHREVLRFNVSLSSRRYGDPATIISFFRQLEERIRQLPGVASIGTAFGPPLSNHNQSGDIRVAGRPEPDRSQVTFASVHPVTPAYFETLGLPLLRGRGIEVTDHEGAPPVAVVNETFVRENFPGQEVLGAGVRVAVSFGFGTTWRIVGVARDVRRFLAAEPKPEVYIPLAQSGSDEPFVIEGLRRNLGNLTVHVRGASDAASLLPAVRDQIAAMDPGVLIVNVETLSDAICRNAAPTRHYFMLVGLFAFLAIALAAAGLYGVVAYLVSRRTREIGIRIALGARRNHVARLVLWQGILPTVVGTAVGLLGAVAGTRLLASLLYQVEPWDPASFVLATAVLIGVALLATFFPTMAALRVAATEAIKAE